MLTIKLQDQAIDRLHRLGQRRPVRALRFVAERTVEAIPVLTFGMRADC